MRLIEEDREEEEEEEDEDTQLPVSEPPALGLSARWSSCLTLSVINVIYINTRADGTWTTKPGTKWRRRQNGGEEDKINYKGRKKEEKKARAKEKKQERKRKEEMKSFFPHYSRSKAVRTLKTIQIYKPFWFYSQSDLATPTKRYKNDKMATKQWKSAP